MFFLKLTKLLLLLALLCNLLVISGCETQNTTVTKISLWHGINPPENRDIFQALVTKFNRQHPNIEVEALYVGQPDGQLPKIFAATVSGEPPDMLWFVPQITGKLAQLGALLSLNDWLNNSPIKAEIDPAMFDSMRLGEQFLSIPFATNNTAIFYRPSLFKEAGITTLPKTWQELKIAARKLTKDTNNDGYLDQHGIILSLGTEEWTVFAWLPFIYSAGGYLLQND